jgi:hypothetical protein
MKSTSPHARLMIAMLVLIHARNVRSLARYSVARGCSWECHLWRLTLANVTKRITFEGHLWDKSIFSTIFQFDSAILLSKLGAGDGNRTRITSLGIKIFALLFSILTKSLSKNLRACTASRACAARCASLRDVCGQFRSSVAVRGYRLRLTFLCARRKPMFEVGDDKLSRCEDAVPT